MSVAWFVAWVGRHRRVCAAIVAAAAALVVVAVGAFAGGRGAERAPMPDALSGADQYGQVIGSDGSVFVTEYVDLICGSCARNGLRVAQELLPYVADGRLVIRRIPIGRVAQESRGLAYAAAAAAQQNRMWQFTHAWFLRVADGRASARAEDMVAVARDAGLDMDRFVRDFADEAARAADVTHSNLLAERDQVTSTPTLIITRTGQDQSEGTRLMGVQPPGALTETIERVLAGE